MPQAANPLVLVLEDDTTAAAALAGVIEDGGFRTEIADSAEQAIARLGADIDELRAIVADYRLAGGPTGHEAASRVMRAAGRLVPTLIITAFAEHAERASPHKVLSKPVDPAMLEAWLAEHV